MKTLKIGNVLIDGTVKGFINRITFNKIDNIYYELIINRKFTACFMSVQEMNTYLLKNEYVLI